MSTGQAAILLIDELISNVDKAILVSSTFFDLSKAFDTTSYSQLITTLPIYGVHDRELCWFIDSFSLISSCQICQYCIR